MFCPECGAKLNDGSTLCGSCGTKLETQVNQNATNPTEAESVNNPSPQTKKKSGAAKVIIPIIAVVYKLLILEPISCLLLVEKKDVFVIKLVSIIHF